jgi:REP element-mobilizing transposase RayT/mono/diheme cytochrome c family protein
MNSEDSYGRARQCQSGSDPGAPLHRKHKQLPHDRPIWIRPEDEIFFITICCQERKRNQLSRPEIAPVIFDSVRFRNQNHVWFAHLVLLMPDHLHGLISFPSEQSMKQIVANWKRFLATNLKIDWQRDFFDHRLRRDESFVEKANYIRANPIRAGFVNRSEDWPYFWTPNIDNKTVIDDRALHPSAPGGRALPILVVAALLLTTACRRDMMNQPKAKPLSQSEFFKDGANARLLPPNTVARGEVRQDEAFYTGLTGGIYVTQLPMKLTPELLARGRERYETFCSACHGRVGDGQGAVVLRGFPQPPSYHLERLRNAPLGHFFDAITNGYGAMTSYAAQVEPSDRWAIAAYIRTLQLSQNAKPGDLPAEERNKLESAP